MKCIKVLAITIVASITLISTFAVVRGAQADFQLGQQRIFEGVTDRLEQDGVPIKSSRIAEDSRCNPPLVAEYVLQSLSKSDEVSPYDPIYSNVVGREVNLAGMRGLGIGGTRVILVNTTGKVLSNITNALKKDKELPAGFDQPSILSVNEVSALLADFPSFGSSHQDIEVALNREGLMTVTFNIKAGNAEEVNSTLTSIIKGTRSRLIKLNQEQRAQIATYKININDSEGQPLLMLIHDIQFGNLSWWQSDTLTEKWYPHPGTSPP